MDAATITGRILDVLKMSATPALAIAFASGLLLFGSDNVLATLGLAGFMLEARPWVGLAFLISTTLLFAHVAAVLGLWIRKRVTWFAEDRRLQRQLRELSPDEQGVLARFLLERRKTLSFPLADGVASSLIQARILVRVAQVGYPDAWDLTMQPWAWTYLNKRPHLVLKDAVKLKLLAERTAIADAQGFEDGRAPWDEDDEELGPPPWRRRQF